MGGTTTQTVNCYCDNIIETEIPDLIDLDEQPGIADEIVEGEYLNIVCDRCGKVLKPEFELNFRSSLQHIALKFLPEIAREGFYKGDIDPGEVRELVIGYKELIEYFLARKLGIQRLPLEALKLHLLQRAPSSSSLEIYLAGKEGETLTFTVLGLREDEIGLVKVPFSSYQELLEKGPTLVDSEPYAALLRGPYLSINLVSFEEEGE